MCIMCMDVHLHLHLHHDHHDQGHDQGHDHDLDHDEGERGMKMKEVYEKGI